MDISETYIKMCDCEEIQSQWKPTEGDTFINRVYSLCDTQIWPKKAKGLLLFCQMSGQYIWLPRQDQLQLLSGLSWYLFDKTCVTWATTNQDYQRESKEIVGLRVVMHTVHNIKLQGVGIATTRQMQYMWQGF